MAKRNPRICTNCGIRNAAMASRIKDITYYKKECNICKKYPNLKEKAKQTTCSGCHKSYHPIQLDVDHVRAGGGEGYSNLQILCANCHRMKTHLCKDTRTKDNR